MKLNVSIPSTLALVAMLALPGIASAQSSADNTKAQQPSVAKLQVDGGVIMLSRGQAAFASGATDDPVFPGERLMVSAQSSATVVYSDGCKQTYDKPGIYKIEADCKASVAFSGERATGGQIAAWAVTGLGVVALIENGQGGGQVPPVSR